MFSFLFGSKAKKEEKARKDAAARAQRIAVVKAELKAELKSELEAEEKTKAKREVDQKAKREAEEKDKREAEQQNQIHQPLSKIKERLAEVSQIASSSKMEEAVLLRQVQDMEGTIDVS